VYQYTKVSPANGSTSTQYVCPAWRTGLSFEDTDVTTGPLGTFETDQDSSTAPGSRAEVLIKLMTAPFAPLM
jgi:hypothetical protein